MDDRTHISEPQIPTDPIERRNLVWWLFDHPIWNYTITDGRGREYPISARERLLLVEPAYVNPATEEKEDDHSLNTAFRVWVEAGPMHDCKASGDPEPPEGWGQDNQWIRSHDYRLDGGAEDLETALCRLAGRVKTFYNDDGTDKDLWPCTWKEGNVTCVPGDPPDFCANCGFKIR